MNFEYRPITNHFSPIVQVADLDQTVVETDEDYQDDYYDVVADIDIRSQSKPRRGGRG